MATIKVLLRDLQEEQDGLYATVVAMPDQDWQLPTPSAGWNVADQIGHLAYFDDAAATAILHPAQFADMKFQLENSLGRSVRDVDDLTLGPFRQLGSGELLGRWALARERLSQAARSLTRGQRVPWYGPSMSGESLLTARLMETWAHGEDVNQAIGYERTPTMRLRHVSHLGFITRGWSYSNRGLELPDSPVWVRLVSPDGSLWCFGDSNATDIVSGSALDFCRVVTQRRHVDDTHLELTGAGSREWLLLAQAFAGPPTTGPAASACLQ